MINKISDYIEPIIVLIIAITVIELILPNNKNKKYVMFTCSLIIVISIINPLLKIFNSDINVSETIKNIKLEMNDMEYSSFANYDLNYNIYNSYIKKLENDMTVRLEDMGYQVLESKLNVDEKTYEPESIELKVKYDDGYIQPVIISVFENISNEEIYEVDVDKIKEILVSNYGVEKGKIKVNQR